MKSIMKIGFAALLGMLFLSACSTKEESVEMPVVEKHMTASQLKSAIMAAGKEQGWKMTEFKNDEILAEKFGDDAVAVSIEFDRTGFEIHGDHDNGQIEDLKEAINDHLSAGSSH